MTDAPLLVVWLLQEEEFDEEGSHWATLGVYPDQASVQAAAEETVEGRDAVTWDRETIRGVPVELGGVVDEDRAVILWEYEPPEREPATRRLTDGGLKYISEMWSADVTQAMQADLAISALFAEKPEGGKVGG